MTKMTLLHFASPFAFSMPAPVPPPAPSSRGAAAATQAGPDDADPLSAPTDEVSGRRDTGPASSFESAGTGTGDEGFAASAYDMALRRYLEQQGSPDSTEAAELDPEHDEDDRPD